MKYAVIVLSLGITAFIISPSHAQDAAVDSVREARGRQAYPAASITADTLQEYNLAEIVVLSGEDQITSPTTVQRVRLAALARQDARSSAEFARLIPAAHVQTNSRGETLVHLRNAGERQVAFYFDGALLNVPWDHRADLGLVPASVVGGMTILDRSGWCIRSTSYVSRG